MVNVHRLMVEGVATVPGANLAPKKLKAGIWPRPNPVPGGQAAVRLRQDAVTRPGKEHCPRDDAIRAGPFVDGASAAAGDAGMGAPATALKGLR